MATTEVIKEALWLKGLLREANELVNPVVVYSIVKVPPFYAKIMLLYERTNRC